MEIRRYEPWDREDVVRVWRECELINDPEIADAMIERKMSLDGNLFVGVEDGEIVGTIMVGDEGRRGWLNLLAVDSARRRAGLGAQLVRYAEDLLTVQGCPKVNLQIRLDNQDVVAFYERLGYRDDRVISLGKSLPTSDAPPDD